MWQRLSAPRDCKSRWAGTNSKTECCWRTRTLQQRLAAESRFHNLPINATYIDILHVHCLKNDKMAADLVARAIEVTKNLNVGILMTVFFGKCSVENESELQYVAHAFKDLAPVAEKAAVVLGFENLLNARDQATAMDIVASDYFKVYYDVGNSTNRVGVNAPQEIRWLGRDRICQFHFKDNGYLGEGPVNFREVLKAIDDIGFEGHANLETNAPSGDWQADLRRNLDYLNTLRG